MFGKYDKLGNVICQECGKPFKQITDRHLKVSHNISLRDYVKKYKSFPLTRIHLSKIEMDDEVTVIIRGPDGKQRYITSTVKDFFTDKIKQCMKEILKEKSTVKVVGGKVIDRGIEISTNCFVEEKKSLFDSKEDIIKYLKLKYKDLKENYSVEYLTSQGDCAFKYMSDMVIISKKIFIEFPDIFWHNRTSFIPTSKFKRINDLKSIGWTLIEIKGRAINKKEVYNQLKVKLEEIEKSSAS